MAIHPLNSHAQVFHWCGDSWFEMNKTSYTHSLFTICIHTQERKQTVAANDTSYKVQPQKCFEERNYDDAGR